MGIPLTINEIASSIGGVAHANNKIEYIATDSKEVLPGDLFIALQGNKHNGEDYVLEAINRGAIPMSTAAYSKGIRARLPRSHNEAPLIRRGGLLPYLKGYRGCKKRLQYP